MKSAAVKRDVTTNTASSRGYTIKATGKAFKVLIDGLYGDKITSITRELWSNALDSHANCQRKDVPFDVSFPTAFDPTFRVRDYGCGMSHEVISTVYSTMFESTKEDSIDEVGQLGLGAKSPFSYTDSFNVMAYDGRMCRHYTAMIGNDYIPTLHSMGATESSEPQGIEVSFAVDLGDLPKFQKAAKAVSVGFDVKPNISTADALEVEWPEMDVVYRGRDYTIHRTCPVPGRSHKPYAQMGCVIYPIDVEQLPDLTQTGKWLMQQYILIEFPMGDLEFIASREALSYGRHEPTIESLTTRINAIAEEIAEQTLRPIAEADTLWQANATFHTAGIHWMHASLRHYIEDKARWRGKRVSGVMRFAGWTDDGLEIMSLDPGTRKTLSWISGSPYANVNPARTQVYIEDRTSGPVRNASQRIKEHFDTQTKALQLMWVRYHGGGAQAVRSMLDLMDQIEGADIAIVNDLVPPKTVRNRRGNVAVRQMSNVGSKFYIEATWDTIDASGSQFIVPLAFGVPEKHLPGDTSLIRQCLFEIGEFPTHRDSDKKPAPIWGVPKSCMKQFEDGSWIHLHDHAHAVLDARIAEHRKALEMRSALTDHTDRWIHTFVKHTKCVPAKLRKDSALAPILKRHKQMGEYCEGFDRDNPAAKQAETLCKIAILAKELNREDEIPVNTGLSEAVTAEFLLAAGRYELCHLIPHYIGVQTSTKEIVRRYIETVDLAHSK